MTTSWACIIALLVAAGAGCNKTNPNYCDEQTPCSNGGTCDVQDHSCSMVDAAGPACTTSTDCVTQDLPFCDTSISACVECGPGGPSACGGTSPFCEDHSCRGCELDSECPSEVCLPDGSCADGGRVLYVTDPGAGTTCDAGAPCPLLTALTSITPTKNVIKLDAKTYLIDTITIPADVRIVGRAATLRKNTGTGPVVIVSGHAVEFDFLTIANGDGLSGDGVQCTTSGQITIRNATLTENDGIGVSGSNCTLTIDQAEIGPNPGAGVVAFNGSLTLTRSEIHGNANGGVFVSGNLTGAVEFSISNNIIYKNGSTAPFGGVRVDSITMAGTHELVFNTVTQNVASGVSGVACVSGVPLAFENNIIFNQMSGSDVPATPQGCTHSYSDIGTGMPGGTNNVSSMPTFAGGDDYHLMPTSPVAIGQANPSSTMMIDFDGDPRPMPSPGPSDVGADEIP